MDRRSAPRRRAAGWSTARRARLCLVAVLVMLAACTPAVVEAGPDLPATPPSSALALPVPFPTQAFQDVPTTPLDPERARELQRVLDEVAKGTGLSGGVTAAVVDAGAGTWAGAAGTADGVRPMTPEDQLNAGLLTQAVVAAAVMRLVEDGLVDLNAPVAEYLPAGLGFDPGPATVRQLLGMASGIPSFYGVHRMSVVLREDRRRVWTPEEVLGQVGDRRLPPGGPTSYSATNYLLLGLVIENVTGVPLAAALRADVLAGPGLERMVVQPDEAPSPPVAAPFGAGLDPLVALEAGGGYIPSLSEVTASRGAGAIASDAVSLGRWWARLCGGHVVSRTALTVMMRIEGSGRAGYGLGLVDLSSMLRMPAVGGYTQGPGYAALAACLPTEGTVVVVMTNHHGPIKIFLVASQLVDAVS